MSSRIRLGLPSLLAVLLSPAAAAQPTITQDQPSIAEGRRLLQEGELERAEGAFRSLAEAQPQNGEAWMLLGLALHTQGDYEEALVFHEKAAGLQSPFARAASYNAVCALARLERKDEAFQRLAQLIRTGARDVRKLAEDPDLESLTQDERAPRFFVPPADFDQPFVEVTRVIHVWSGEAGDQFGWIARSLGDVDGDGVADITTSAPSRATASGASAGAVFVFSGKSGERLWSQTGQPGEQLGLGIEAAGDVDADGTPDVIAGAPGSSRAYVYSGKDGRVVRVFRADGDGELFGRKVSDLGDLNGDGHDDVFVGAPNASTQAGAKAGKAYLFSGKDGERLLLFEGERAGDQLGSAGAGLVWEGEAWIVVGAPNVGPRGRTYVYDAQGDRRFVIEADATGGALGGMFVSVVGDVDADGTPDVYASDWANSAKGRVTGRIYVHSGRDGRRLLTLTGESAGEGFGIGPADAGDVNGDGHADLIVGAWQHGGAAASGGKATVFSGQDGSVLRAITCRVPGDTFGFDATGVGDVDGDGLLDFLVTSAWSSVAGRQSGRVFVIAGSR